MSITDELRKVAHTIKTFTCEVEQAEQLLTIADRIDKRYEEMLEFCGRIYRAAINHKDVTLWNVDYTALPVDADGKQIHIGDRMENGELVARIVLTDGSWKPTVYTAATPNQLHEYYCHDIRHHHEPTVEDVLREFALAVCKDDALTIRKDVVDEYAAKLRLADGKEQ